MKDWIKDQYVKILIVCALLVAAGFCAIKGCEQTERVFAERRECARNDPRAAAFVLECAKHGSSVRGCQQSAFELFCGEGT